MFCNALFHLCYHEESPIPEYYGQNDIEMSAGLLSSELQEQEIDRPDSVFCTMCRKFHSRSEVWMPISTDKDDGNNTKHTAFVCRAKSLKLALPNQNEISFWTAHLVMKAHRLTSAHGIDQSTLHFCCKEGEWFSEVSSKIIENRLLVYVESWCDYDVDNPTNVLENVPCCRHFWRDIPFLILLRIQSPDKPHNLRGDIYLAKYSRTCSICPSEHILDCKVLDKETRRPMGKVPTITREKCRFFVRRWIDLGDCCSPSSREWRSIPYPSRLLSGAGWRKSFPFRMHGLPSIRKRYENAKRF